VEIIKTDDAQHQETNQHQHQQNIHYEQLDKLKDVENKELDQDQFMQVKT